MITMMMIKDDDKGDDKKLKDQSKNNQVNQFNKDQGGPSNRPPNQGPNLYERTTKLEETFAQFM